MSPNEAALFASLYEEHQRHVYAYCRRRVTADIVDDVVADVYLAVWRRISDAPTADGIRPWLYRIAYLVTSNHWRGASRRRKLESKLESIGVSSGVSIPDQIIVREEVREALQILERLNSNDREIIKLSVWEELSNPEISAVLQIDENTVRQRLFRAKKRLTREYEQRLEQRLEKSAAPAAQKGGER